MEGIDAVLCLRPASLGLTAHPLELSSVEVECALTGLLLLLVTLFALGEVIVVVPLIAVEMPAVKLDDLVADAVKEVAVVGDE